MKASARSRCAGCGASAVNERGLCEECGLAEDPKYFLKVVDRRGTNSGKLESRIRPDVITEIKETADPLEWIAVFPGNRVKEQRFKLNRLEARGFKLLSKQMPIRSKDEEHAASAARRKVLKVIERAVKVHTAASPAASPGVH